MRNGVGVRFIKKIRHDGVVNFFHTTEPADVIIKTPDIPTNIRVITIKTDYSCYVFVKTENGYWVSNNNVVVEIDEIFKLSYKLNSHVNCFTIEQFVFGQCPDSKRR